MSKTVRRKPWYPEVSGFEGKKKHRDGSCKPGCGVCEKDDMTRRARRIQWRQEDKKAITEQMEDQS